MRWTTRSYFRSATGHAVWAGGIRCAASYVSTIDNAPWFAQSHMRQRNPIYRNPMASELQPPRGTHDLIGEDQRRHTHVVETARRIAALYGFDEWTTPVFEDTRVFSRTLGETSDVVTKEMYSFTDRGGDPITLRPEATAGICRALVSNGLTQSLPQKVFMAGPMFRYERPQKGRYRQFHQIDIEVLGTAEPLADAEVIACGWTILQALGVAGETVLEINTLGDTESRDAYRTALVSYFTRHRDALSKDSLERLERNPLRILDSKDEGDRRLIANAPVIVGHLTNEAAAFYAGLRTWLDRFGVPYRENPRIVRGLDYYGHTAFEFVTTKLGAQGTVMGGGRYDGLVQEMGGPPTPAVGLAAGIERLAMLMDDPPHMAAPVAVVPIGEAAEGAALEVLQSLRSAGVRAEMAYRGNLRRRMERANRIGARAAVILGPDDLAQGVVQVKRLETGEQEAVPIAEVVTRLR
jgi:histidyl-tRNA synthetase